MRTILTESEAFELLNPYFENFKYIYNESHKSLEESIRKDMSNGITKFNPSYKAMTMWHYAINYSSIFFANHEEFKPCIINKIYGLRFNDALFIRLKKLKANHHTSNIPTKQASALLNQLEIEGFPSSPCILTIGYNMDKAFTHITSIHVVCEKGKKEFHWKYDILNQNEPSKLINFSYDDEKVSESIEKLLTIKEEKKAKKKDIINE